MYVLILSLRKNYEKIKVNCTIAHQKKIINDLESIKFKK